MIISNRTIERASRLCEELGKTFPGVEFASTGLDISRFAPETDLLINTTSSGMMAGQDERPVVAIDALKKGAIVSDIVFRPLDTPLIKEASRLGLTAHKGLGMLVCQGALAFELWTGKEPPIEGHEVRGHSGSGGQMRIVFIADSHAKGPDDPSQKQLSRFLEALSNNPPERLVILGDLFDFWIGTSGLVFITDTSRYSRLC